MTSIDINPLRITSTPAHQRTHVDIEEAAYQENLTAILEQRLLPGAKLGEQWLIEKFDISRARDRHILLRLVQDHMVTQHPHRGAYVAGPTLAEACDLMQARRTLEERIVAMVSVSITSRDIAELSALIEREIAARHRGDWASTLRAACDFHLKLAEFAGNRVLYDIVRDLVSQSSLVIARNREATCPVCPADDHPGILEAIRVGDVERVVAAMDEHLRNVERTLWRHDDGARRVTVGAKGTE